MYDDFEDEEEEVFNEELEKWKEEHHHCINCFDLNCSKRDVCEMVRCKQCSIYMHSCKLEDHLYGVCPRSPIECPLTQYGCNTKIYRNHLAAHLKLCNAYVLYCNFCWNRSFVSLIAKRFFKKVAKELEETRIFNANEIDADSEILMALQDQKQIFGSFKCSRFCRVKQRDYANRTHPLLPLMYKQVAQVYSAMDSSDEEEEDEERVMRSTPQAFAGCPICRTDPGEQHLHILGNTNLKDDCDPNLKSLQTTSSLPLELLLPVSNLKYNLFLKNEYGRANARSMINSKLFHMFCCGQLLRLNEYWDHQKYHNDISHPEQARFLRCQFGCGFGVEKYVPSKGEFKFDSYFGTILYVYPNEVEKLDDFDINLTKLLTVLSLADNYLDTASLNALCGTCSFIRSNIYDYFPHRYFVYRNWKKKRHIDGRIEWLMDDSKHKFSKVQISNWKIEQNSMFSGQMEVHRKECKCKDENDNALLLNKSVELIELMKSLGAVLKTRKRVE